MPRQRISVLLPCRDAAPFLSQAIRSLEMQTLHDFEVVVVDDGSVDQSPGILQAWAERDRRVTLLRTEPLGLTAALRRGADACSGELLARFDADDVAHPRRLATQLEFLSERREIAAAGTRVRYFPSERVGWGARRYERWLNSLTAPGDLARDIFVECPIAHPTLMVRRVEFERIGGYRDVEWPEDYDLVLRLHAAGARLANVPRVLHFWRERPERASRVDEKYSSGSFRLCKTRYLSDRLSRSRRRLAVWGAGSVGKAMARSLSRSGCPIEAFYDIDPDKIGQRIHDAPVLSADLAGSDGLYVLVAVGASGARSLIRRQLVARGLAEPGDFLCVA